MQAKYTVVLKTLMDNEHAKAKLDEAMATYPLYVQKEGEKVIPTRDELNATILNNYKYREIAFETVGRFLDELKIALHEIMPYYNDYFKSVEIMANIKDPFGNVDVTETYEETRTDTSSTEGTSTNKQTSNGTQTNEETSNTSNSDLQKNKRSDTPQNSVSNIDNYLSNYEENSNTGTQNNTQTSSGTNTDSLDAEASSSGTTQSSGTVSHIYRKTGNQGVNTYAHDMNEFRTSIINVVQDLINDERLSELFLRVY